MVMKLAIEISEKNYGVITELSIYYINLGFLEGLYTGRVKCALTPQ